MTKRYFKLSFDDSNYQAIVCRKYYLDNVDKYAVNKAMPIVDWPDNVTFYYDMGHPEDYLGNSLGWLLFSERVQKVFTDLGILNVQFLPVKVVNEKGDEYLHGYAVANILDRIPALDRKYAKYEDNQKYPELPIIYKVVLLSEAISGLDIFRLKEKPVLVFVSKKVKDQIEETNCTGFRFMPVPVT